MIFVLWVDMLHRVFNTHRKQTMPSPILGSFSVDRTLWPIGNRFTLLATLFMLGYLGIISFFGDFVFEYNSALLIASCLLFLFHILLHFL